MTSSKTKTYTVVYKMFSFEQVYRKTSVQAMNKTQAYDNAIYHVIPGIEKGNIPYSLYIK